MESKFWTPFKLTQINTCQDFSPEGPLCTNKHVVQNVILCPGSHDGILQLKARRLRTSISLAEVNHVRCYCKKPPSLSWVFFQNKKVNRISIVWRQSQQFNNQTNNGDRNSVQTSRGPRKCFSPEFQGRKCIRYILILLTFLHNWASLRVPHVTVLWTSETNTLWI